MTEEIIPKAQVPYDYNTEKEKSSEKVPFSMVILLAILSGRPRCIVILLV
jgi:hypothetical protein